MKTVTFTEFRKNASNFFSAVENGEVVIVLRHGKPIAEISPPCSQTNEPPSWKKPGLKIKANGISLAKAILEEREAS